MKARLFVAAHNYGRAWSLAKGLDFPVDAHDGSYSFTMDPSNEAAFITAMEREYIEATRDQGELDPSEDHN